MKTPSWTAGVLAGMSRCWPARTPAVQVAAAFMLFSASTAALAQEQTEAPATLLSESINLAIIDGSVVPEDCMYPASISDTARFEIACVTMPRFASGEISVRYLGQLGEAGWRQGNYISGGMTAVRTDENNCRHVLNMFPSDFPPGTENSATVVLWFALDRTPRCNESGAQ